jgi:hypothetical protein
VVLAFVLLGALLLDHFVIYGRKRHNRQANTSKHQIKMSLKGDENRWNR